MFREEDRALVMRPGFAFTIDFDLHTRLSTAHFWHIYVLLESQSSLVHLSQPIPRCREKDLSYPHVGDPTDISRSTTVALNSTYYAPHHHSQVLSTRSRLPP